MDKITAYTRLINKGNSNGLFGATIPITNDHTDGSWLPTDIYDREIFINTSTNLMDYRGGNTIYSPVTTDISRKVKQRTWDIGPWNMTNTAFQPTTPTFASNLQVINVDVWVIDDAQQFIFPLTYTDIVYDEPWLITVGQSPFPINVSFTLLFTANNRFWDLANSNLDYFSVANNRGWITVQYIE